MFLDSAIDRYKIPLKRPPWMRPSPPSGPHGALILKHLGSEMEKRWCILGEVLPTGALLLSPAARPWFVIRVKPRHERTVARALGEKGFAQLLPLHRCSRRWSDRIKVLDLPLFPGYVFCRFDFEDELRVLQTPGVRSVVSFGDGPAPMPEEEIKAIGAIVQSQIPAEPTSFLPCGHLVCITQGSLAGVQGFLQQVKNKTRLVVSVMLLQRSIAVEIDASWVVPLHPRALPHVPPEGGIPPAHSGSPSQ